MFVRFYISLWFFFKLNYCEYLNKIHIISRLFYVDTNIVHLGVLPTTFFKLKNVLAFSHIENVTKKVALNTIKK